MDPQTILAVNHALRGVIQSATLKAHMILMPETTLDEAHAYAREIVAAVARGRAEVDRITTEGRT